MGGLIGLAIVSTVMNSYVTSKLDSILSPQQVSDILSTNSIAASLQPAVQQQVKSVFADGYTLQMKILTGLVAGQIPAALLMWQRDQIVL